MSKRKTKNPKGRPAVSPASKPPVEGVTAPKPRPQLSASEAARLRRGLKP